jgi:uncharacterized protein (DUF433 family)
MVVIPDELKSILESTPDTINGNVRFRGTRIQARLLFDYVLSGEGLDEFLADFPDVKKEDALALLDWEHRNVTLKLESAA